MVSKTLTFLGVSLFQYTIVIAMRENPADTWSEEHFASIRGCAPAPVSEETQRCRDFPTMDSVVVGRVTGMDFTEFKAEEAARIAKMNEEANSFKGHLKRKMSRIRSLSWGNDWREDQHMALF